MKDYTTECMNILKDIERVRYVSSKPVDAKSEIHFRKVLAQNFNMMMGIELYHAEKGKITSEMSANKFMTFIPSYASKQELEMIINKYANRFINTFNSQLHQEIKERGLSPKWLKDLL